MIMVEQEYLSLQEAAKLLHISEGKIRQMVKKKMIPAVRIGNRYRINKVELIQCLDRI